jgi:hypothetical protein
MADYATQIKRLSRAAALCLAALAAAGLIVAACGDSPTSPSGSGSNLRLMLTDAPAGVDQVRIYFTGVTAKPVGRSVERLSLEIADNPIDLLTLDDRVIGFATGVVEPGDYEFIHIDIDEDRSYIVERGERKSLQIPSEEIKVVGGFSIDDDNVTTLTLDFDADRSLVQLGNGRWLMRPVVVITGHNSSSRD